MLVRGMFWDIYFSIQCLMQELDKKYAPEIWYVIDITHSCQLYILPHVLGFAILDASAQPQTSETSWVKQFSTLVGFLSKCSLGYFLFRHLQMGSCAGKWGLMLRCCTCTCIGYFSVFVDCVVHLCLCVRDTSWIFVCVFPRGFSLPIAECGRIIYLFTSIDTQPMSMIITNPEGKKFNLLWDPNQGPS